MLVSNLDTLILKNYTSKDLKIECVSTPILNFSNCNLTKTTIGYKNKSIIVPDSYKKLYSALTFMLTNAVYVITYQNLRADEIRLDISGSSLESIRVEDKKEYMNIPLHLLLNALEVL